MAFQTRVKVGYFVRKCRSVEQLTVTVGFANDIFSSSNHRVTRYKHTHIYIYMYIYIHNLNMAFQTRVKMRPFGSMAFQTRVKMRPVGFMAFQTCVKMWPFGFSTALPYDTHQNWCEMTYIA